MHPDIDLDLLDRRIGDVHLVEVRVLAKSADVLEGLSETIEIKPVCRILDISRYHEIGWTEHDSKVGSGVGVGREGREEHRVNVVVGDEFASPDLATILPALRQHKTVGLQEHLHLQQHRVVDCVAEGFAHKSAEFEDSAGWEALGVERGSTGANATQVPEDILEQLGSVEDLVNWRLV